MKSKKVLITGSSKGIGMAAALAFGREGYTVIATMRNPDGYPQLASIVDKEELPVYIRTMDVDNDVSVNECFKEVYEEFGAIDVLINNAGIERRGSIEEASMDVFKAVMETNYFGVIRCVKAVMPHMRKAKSGCIINVSSVAGKISNPPLGPYSASKFALEAISETLAIEAKPFDIHVYLIEPGIIDTPMARSIATHEESIYPHKRRFAGLFLASLEKPVSPDVVAEKMLWIVKSKPATFRHPVGPDSEPFLGWRASLKDEQWINWHAVSDEEWFDQVQNDFGLDARKALSIEH